MPGHKGGFESKGMDMERADRAFRFIVRILYEYKIPFWADYGTCLGFEREKNFIKKDYDIDLGTPFSSLAQLLSITEINSHENFVGGIYPVGKPLIPMLWSMTIFGQKVDLYFWYEYKDFSMMIRGYNEKRKQHVLSILDKKFHTQFKTFMYQNEVAVNMPKDTDEYLTTMYEDWRTPATGSGMGGIGYLENFNDVPQIKRYLKEKGDL